MKTWLAWTSVGLFASALTLASCAQGTSATTTGDDGSDASTSVDASTGDGGGNDAGGTCPTVCTGTTPFCDTSTKKCVACLPSNDTCPSPTYCLPSANGYQCAPGCKVNSDCTSDAGVGEGGAQASLTCCNHACVDVTSSAANCGMCGHSCGGGGDGGAGGTCCSSTCVDTSTSATNCGSCGKTCMGTHVTNSVCAMASCGFDTCWTGYGDCDSNKANGCETPTSADPMRCGGCTDVCSANHITTPTCTLSTCDGACDTGFADCNTNKLTDGCETNTAGDPLHCGACGTACSANHITTPLCTTSACVGACDVGYSDCNANKQTDGCEIATGTDVLNCGGCHVICSTANIGVACGGGVCNGACTAGFADCNANKQADGCERSITSLTDCGACGVPCAPANATGPTCATLTCNYGSCNSGFQDCDSNRPNGCESNKNTDNANCGSCGHVCTGGTACFNGTCAVKVLVAAAEQDSALAALQTQLNGTGAFGTVDVINTQNSTPTVAVMQGYSVILAWTDYGGGVNEQAFFDNLATYYDGGGRVVLAQFVIGGFPSGPVGRFLQPGNGYMLFNVTTQNAYANGGAQTLGTVFEPASPLMAGVTSPTSTGWQSTEPLLAGAVVVANWSNGKPFIVRGTVQGRNRVDLNLWCDPTQFGGGSITAIKNALLF